MDMDNEAVDMIIAFMVGERVIKDIMEGKPPTPKLEHIPTGEEVIAAGERLLELSKHLRIEKEGGE